MIWLRKGFVLFLSLILLLSLLGVALSTSTSNTLGKPKKIETYLSQSKLYDHFIDYTADQAKKSNGDNDQSGSVSLSDSAVQQAAQQAFPSSLIQQSVNTFIDSNYAWLEGKTATPSFKIDLSSQKETFAQKVGRYVKNYTAGLPVCTTAQAAAEQGKDPLTATCRPPQLTPEQAGAQVTQRISNTGDFLSNPVITASSVNPKGNNQSKPYYVKLSQLPKAYRLGQKLPYIFGALSLLCAIGIIFISLSRRRGWRRVGFMLLTAGIILIVLKFVADFIVKKAEHRVFNNANVGQLQRSLTDFAHRVESNLVKTDLIFGIAFLVLAAIILGYLAKTRQKAARMPTDISGIIAEEPATPLTLSGKRFRRPGSSSAGQGVADRPSNDGSEPPKPKRPPRLIQ